MPCLRNGPIKKGSDSCELAEKVLVIAMGKHLEPLGWRESFICIWHQLYGYQNPTRSSRPNCCNFETFEPENIVYDGDKHQGGITIISFLLVAMRITER